MKKREYAEAVERCIPQTPPAFHQAMSRTLEAIAAQAPPERPQEPVPPFPRGARWRLRWRRCCSSPPRRWPRPIGTSLTP